MKPITPAKIVEIAKLISRDFKARPEVLRCAADVGAQVMRWEPQMTIRFGLWGPVEDLFPSWHWDGPAVLKLALDVTTELAPGGWRLCSTEGVLWWDARQGLPLGDL